MFTHFGRVCLTTFTSLCLTISGTAADIIPNRLYVTGITGNLEFDPDLPPDSIFEFDPATGATRFFSTFSRQDCGITSGLAIAPDNSTIRASVYYRRSVMEIGEDGEAEVALDHRDGIGGGPRGSNNIGYAANGDFFVAYSGELLRFPAGGGPREILADWHDGIVGYGPIAVAPDGSVYFGVAESPGPEVLRIAPDGEVTVFDTLDLGCDLSSLSIDNDGNLFALTSAGLYRYDAGNPGSRRLLAALPGSGPHASIVVNPSGQQVFVCRENIFRMVDASTGAITDLGTWVSPEGYMLGGGVVLAVPEPATGVLVLGALISLARRGRGNRADFKVSIRQTHVASCKPDPRAVVG